MISKRKTVLITAILVFAGIYAAQLISGGKNSLTNIQLKELPDTIRVTLPAKLEYTLSRQSDDAAWTLNASTLAEKHAASQIEQNLQTIKVLNRVAGKSEGERFGLNDESVIIAEAFRGGKLLRSLRIGKASATSLQTYIQADKSNEVLLVSGSLGEVFNKSIEQLTSKPEETLPPPKTESDTMLQTENNSSSGF